jgi:flagellar L-ring protein precursor FlgH
MRRTSRVLPLLLLLATGCAMIHRGPSPSLKSDVDQLAADLEVLPPFPVPAPSSGSLWTDAGPGAALARDTRAFRVNDLVTISVDESSIGTNESATDLGRQSKAEYGAPVFFGLENPGAAAGQFNLANVLSTSTDMSHKGDGKTTRSSKLEGYITTRVLRVLPNGDMIVAGQKNVMVNRDRQILTLVGSVRPVDVAPNNAVSSSAVGDLTVRLWGRGELDDTVRQGWFMRVMNRLWPF